MSTTPICCHTTSQTSLSTTSSRCGINSGTGYFSHTATQTPSHNSNNTHTCAPGMCLFVKCLPYENSLDCVRAHAHTSTASPESFCGQARGSARSVDPHCVTLRRRLLCIYQKICHSLLNQVRARPFIADDAAAATQKGPTPPGWRLVQIDSTVHNRAIYHGKVLHGACALIRCVCVCLVSRIGCKRTLADLVHISSMDGLTTAPKTIPANSNAFVRRASIVCSVRQGCRERQAPGDTETLRS